MRSISVLVLVLGCSHETSKEQKLAELAKRGPWADVSIHDMVADYQQNVVGADEKYRNKALRVEGEVVGVDRTAEGVPVIKIRAWHHDSDRNVALCMWSGSTAAAGNMTQRMHVTVKGIGAGSDALGDVGLVFCDY